MERIAAVYPRVSSDDQFKVGKSFPAQINRLTKFCKDNEIEIYKIYDQDGGRTAAIKEDSINIKVVEDELFLSFDLRKRPSFMQMLKDARKGLFNEIIVWKWDRFSRNAMFQKATIILFKRYGVKIIPTDDSKDPMTRDLLGVIAEQEPNKIRERVSSVFEDKFNKGLIIGNPPYGYKYIGKGKDKKIVIDSDKALVVKSAFEMTLEGVKWDKICSDLNLAKSTYFRMVKNPVYYGLIEFKGFNHVVKTKIGIHQPIISKELFDKVQNLKSN